VRDALNVVLPRGRAALSWAGGRVGGQRAARGRRARQGSCGGCEEAAIVRASRATASVRLSSERSARTLAEADPGARQNARFCVAG
jgi:hypothetical protein